MTEEEAALGRAIHATSRIAVRLRRSVAEFEGVAIDAAAIAGFDAAAEQRSDALFKRVENLIAQLQDQVWRLAMAAEQTPARLDTRRERAEWAQRLGLLPRGETFAAAARLRNRLTHEYPDDPAKQAALLRAALDIAPLLLGAADRAEAWWHARDTAPVAPPG